MSDRNFKNMSGAKVSEDKTIVVFMGMDLSTDKTAYWKYDGKEFVEISREEYTRFADND